LCYIDRVSVKYKIGDETIALIVWQADGSL
jgi:hypothetical protein